MPLGGAPLCPACNQRVYFNDEKSFMNQSWHKKCFKCDKCGKQLESTMANLQDSNIQCNACHRQIQRSATVTATRTAYVNHEDGECCPRCGKRVYFAEQILSLGRKWHKTCFTCARCEKKVDVAQAADHDNQLYCRPCHGRWFGPKGYGFAGGAGTMLSMDTGKIGDVATDNIPHTAQAYVAPSSNSSSREQHGWGDGDFCPRCSQQVFIAERRQAAGHVYHSSCFTCNLCHKKLDASSLTEKEDDIFCKTCYSRAFGPKGYGYGTGAGILQTN